jgi:hypothetical protein
MIQGPGLTYKYRTKPERLPWVNATAYFGIMSVTKKLKIYDTDFRKKKLGLPGIDTEAVQVSMLLECFYFVNCGLYYKHSNDCK